MEGQIGLEASPDEWCAELVAVFREVRRVLKPQATLWIEVADSYANDAKWGGTSGGKNYTSAASGYSRERRTTGLKAKDLIGAPWLLAFALRADGWLLRQHIVWSKPNAMPESVRDRCTTAHSHIFMFAKCRWSGPEPGRFDHLSDSDKRWLAAMIDTEGSIIVRRSRKAGKTVEWADAFAAQVAFVNTNEALIHEVQRLTGEGFYVQRRAGEGRPCFHATIGHQRARDLLLAIFPFLVAKKRQARVAIHAQEQVYHRGGSA